MFHPSSFKSPAPPSTAPFMERLKYKIHNSRIPLSPTGTKIAAIVYATVAFTGGVYLMHRVLDYEVETRQERKQQAKKLEPMKYSNPEVLLKQILQNAPQEVKEKAQGQGQIVKSIGDTSTSLVTSTASEASDSKIQQTNKSSQT